MPYEQIGETRLTELADRWRAKELEVSLYARPQIELKMLDVSARALGEAEEPEPETDREKAKEKAVKNARWEEIGQKLKAELRESILFSLQPEHLQAAHVYLNGWPDKKQDDEVPVQPLTGMSKGVARAVMGLVKAQTFSRGEWGNSKLWQQFEEDDGLARKRLEKLAEG